MKINVKNLSRHPLPKYQTEGAAAFDLQANIGAPITLGSLERAVIPTGLFVELPEGYEAQVRGRSGLAARHGIGLANGIGTIDADYRGEWQVILVNVSKEPFTIKDGDRIAQIVIVPVVQAQLVAVEEINTTTRGAGGFGHTGR